MPGIHVRPLRLLALLPALLLVPWAARAQTLAGTVTEAPSGAPVPSVLVELLALDSTRVDRVLSRPDGRYLLEAPEAGAYLVRLRRLGYRTSVLGPVDVRGATPFDPTLPAEPVRLDALVATGERRCATDRDDVGQTELLWEQVVKALEVTRVVQEDALLEFEVLRFVRELDARRSILFQEAQGRWRATEPFEGVDPELLAEGGFIQPSGDGMLAYHAPVPSVLLSDAFLAGHCFRVVEPEDGARLVGLAFEPRDDRPELPDSGRLGGRAFRAFVDDEGADVEGVLWIDRESGALETLDYRYVGFRDDDLEERAGGYARFERLVGGLWVIRQWWVRSPILTYDPVPLAESPYVRVGGVREDGGYLIDAVRADGIPQTERVGVRVAGRLAPGDLPIALDEAVVRLSGSALAARPDAEGRFAFPDVPPGRYLATWYAPLLDTLGIDPPVRPVEVEDSPPPPLELRGFDRAEVLDVVCPDMDPDEGEGVILVAIHGDDDALRRGPPRVTLHTDVVPEWRREAEAVRGGLRFCAVTPGVDFDLEVEGWDERPRIRLAPNAFHRIDVRLGARS